MIGNPLSFGVTMSRSSQRVEHAMGPLPHREASEVAAGAVDLEPGDRGRERRDRRRPGVEVRRGQHLQRILQPGREREERQQRRVGLRESGDQHDVVVATSVVAEQAVPRVP